MEAQNAQGPISLGCGIKVKKMNDFVFIRKLYHCIYLHLKKRKSLKHAIDLV